MFTSDSEASSVTQNNLLLESSAGAEFAAPANYALPPCFRLSAVGESASSILKWDSANETAKAVGPICVGHKQTQHWAAEKLTACADLRRNREFAQPAVELSVAVL